MHLHLADMPVHDVNIECALAGKWLACRQRLELGFAVRTECAVTHVPNTSVHVNTTVKLKFSCKKACRLQLTIGHWSEKLVGLRSTCRLHASANISFELWDFQLHSLIQYMQHTKPPYCATLARGVTASMRGVVSQRLFPQEITELKTSLLLQAQHRS